MNCEICNQNVEITDYMSSISGSQLKIDIEQLQNHICQLCFSRINSYLDHAIQDQHQIQEAIREQLNKIDNNEIVNVKYAHTHAIKEIEHNTKPQNKQISVPLIITKQPTSTPQTTITNITKPFQQLFDIPKVPQNFTELNSLITHFATILAYNNIQNISIAIPYTLFTSENELIPIHFIQKNTISIQKKLTLNNQETNRKSAIGLNYMVSEAQKILKIDNIAILNGEEDQWSKWESQYVSQLFELVNQLFEVTKFV